MAQQGLKAFQDALKADEDLQRRFEEAFWGITDAANDGEAVQKAAAQLGYELSLEELEQAWVEAQELDDVELDAVAGGQDTFNDACWFGWCCHALWRHPDIPDDAQHTEVCWSNYICLASSHDRPN